MNKIKVKKYFIVLLLLLCINFAYAILNSTLTINGSSTINKNTWDVHFENIKVKENSVVPTVNPIISGDTTISNIKLTLEKPGDFYEFTIDVVNNGTIDVMIDFIDKTPDLTAEQAKYLNYIIEYKNGEQVATKQLVKSKELVKIKVRVEYKKDITADELPKETENLSLGFKINYVQSDENGVNVFGNGLIKILNGDGTNVSDEICISEECFYVISSTEDTITMLSKNNITLDTIPMQNSSATKTIFSSTNYWSSKVSTYPAYVYDKNSKLYSYIEAYKKYLESQGVKIEDARPIKMEELEKLGCKRSGTNGNCTSAPSWVSETAYWTGEACSSTSAWFVNNGGAMRQSGSSYGRNSGVRPVIVVSKSLF